jgi:hypothetical protein
VHRIILPQKQLGQIRTILAGNAGNQRSFLGTCHFENEKRSTLNAQLLTFNFQRGKSLIIRAKQLRQILVPNAHFREMLKADSNPVRIAIVDASGGFTRRIALDGANTRVRGYCVSCLFAAGTDADPRPDGAAEDYPLALGKRYLNVRLLNVESSMVISGAELGARPVPQDHPRCPAACENSGCDERLQQHRDDPERCLFRERKSPENHVRARDVGMLESVN